MQRMLHKGCHRYAKPTSERLSLSRIRQHNSVPQVRRRKRSHALSTRCGVTSASSTKTSHRLTCWRRYTNVTSRNMETSSVRRLITCADREVVGRDHRERISNGRCGLGIGEASVRNDMLLQSHKSFAMVGEYDPVMDTFVTLSRYDEPSHASCPISGVFDYVGANRVLLFRLADVLYLQVDGHRMPMADLAIELRSVNGRRVLEVLSHGKNVLELTYDPPHLDPPLALDPTPFVEEEDFDFGLLLANVSRDRNRQARIYGGAGRRQG